MKAILIVLLSTCLAIAQDGAAVNQSVGPPPIGYQAIYEYSGTNITYIGYSRSNQISQSTVTVSAASNASPVSFTATSHGFDYQALATATPTVKITGGTGAWAAINGVWPATPTSANAFTIAVDSTAFGALAGTLVVTTQAPRTFQLRWAIKKLVYSAGGNLIWTGWASNPGGVGATDLVAGASSASFAWASRAGYSYQ